jgi:hypothetical protein
MPSVVSADLDFRQVAWVIYASVPHEVGGHPLRVDLVTLVGGAGGAADEDAVRERLTSLGRGRRWQGPRNIWRAL